MKQFPKLLRSSASFRPSVGHEAEIKLSDAGVKPPVDSIDISFFSLKSGRISNMASTERIDQDLKRFGPQPDLDAEALRTGLFGGHDFARLVKLDLNAAKKSIVIFSGFITPMRAAQMGDLLRRKITDGVRVRCVTRPPRYNGNIPEELGRQALKSLEAIGAAVDLRSRIHEKVVLIDDHIAWFGSLNPLSHTAHTSETMARVENEEVVDSYSKNVGRSPPLAARSQSCWRGACRKSAL